MSTRTIPKGTTIFNSESLFSSHANPCKILVGMVDTSAYIGNFKSNPYNFKRKWTDDQGVSFVESLHMTLNAKSLDGMEAKATERNDTLRYLRFHHFLQGDNNLSCNAVTLKDFLGGTFLGVFDVSTSGHCGFDFLSPATRMGSLRLTIEFSAPSKEEITVILFSEFPSLIKINKARQISLSYY
jgi:hypothetical protein